MSNLELHGKPLTTDVEGYESPDEYVDQGDTRKVRDLQFSYLAASKDAAGNEVLSPVDVPRNAEVKLDQIGLLALERGERYHSFYTTEERDRLEHGGTEEAPTGSDNPNEMGEYELAEYINGNNPNGRPLNVDETVALAGNDKDMAHRLLQAENIATDGDPRKGVEAGLSSIIGS